VDGAPDSNGAAPGKRGWDGLRHATRPDDGAGIGDAPRAVDDIRIGHAPRPDAGRPRGSASVALRERVGRRVLPPLSPREG